MRITAVNICVRRRILLYVYVLVIDVQKNIYEIYPISPIPF